MIPERQPSTVAATTEDGGMPLRIGSLFAGYGGLDLGLDAALGDTEPAWFSEIDRAPSRVLAHHWPDVPNLGDVTTIDWAAAPPVDVLTGGFPCQDVSVAGLRRGLRPDTRSGLWAQGLPAGHVTDPAIGLTRNEQLRALGNGVVPQQAALALRTLLTGEAR